MNQDYNQQGQPYQAPQQPYQSQPQYQPTYNYQTPPPAQKNSNGVGVAALICGIAGFFCNPFYLVCFAAVLLGIVGLCQSGKPKGTSIAGLILGITGTIAQIIVDLILSVFTLGMSFFI